MKKILLSIIVLAGLGFYYFKNYSQHNDVVPASVESECEEEEEDVVDWVDKLDELEASYAAYVEKIKSNPSLLDSETDNIVKSDDGNLTIHCWYDDTINASSAAWANIIKYKYNGKEYVKYYVESMFDSTPESERSPLGGFVTNTYRLKTKDNRAIYLVCEGFYESDYYAAERVTLLEIKDGDLIDVERPQDKGYYYGVYYEYRLEDWIDERCGIDDERYGCIQFDRSAQVLYVPEVDDATMTGRYIKYHFNGEKMVPEDTTCSYGLHSSIKDFKFMESVFDTEKFRVRIDRMPYGEYRYSSWKRGVSMATKPDLIIYGDYVGHGVYSFENNGYVYAVDLGEGLRVTHNNKVIVDQNRICREEF